MKYTNKHYYKFWLKSSRGTDEIYIRCYIGKPNSEQLKADVEEWASHFAAWEASEIRLAYGWERIAKNRLPRTMRELRYKWNKANKTFETAKKRRDFFNKLHTAYLRVSRGER